MKTLSYRAREFFEFAPIVGRKIAWELRKDRIARACIHPEEFTAGFGQRYDWKEIEDDSISLDNLQISVSSPFYRLKILANFEGWHISQKREGQPRFVFISHFATRKDSKRKGFGSGVLQGMFRHLSNRYGVTQMRFNENDQADRYPDYPPFFTALGATLSEERPNDRPLWIWNLSEINSIDRVRALRKTQRQ